MGGLLGFEKLIRSGTHKAKVNMKAGTRTKVNFSGAGTHGSLARVCIITDLTVMNWMNMFIEASGETGSTVLE